MKIRYTPRANSDLRSIHEYIAREDRRAAENVIIAIRRAAVLIGNDPNRGHVTEVPGVLRIPVIKYRYATYFRTIADAVYIVHIRHSSRRSPEAGEL